jgi:hypothetical protein
MGFVSKSVSIRPSRLAVASELTDRIGRGEDE